MEVHPAFDNMSLMNESGVTVYIEADPEELAARLMASKTVRPLIAGNLKMSLYLLLRNI